MTRIQTTQIEVPIDLIDFGVGHPGFPLLPLPLMRRAAGHRLAQEDASFLQYGTEQGDGYFRLALAHFLREHYEEPVEAENLFVSSGASQSLDLICSLFTRPGDVVFVEEPTYFLALRIFADHGLQAVSLPTDDQGLVVEALEEKLQHQRPALLYTIPTFQNPTSITMAGDRRERLVELSRKHRFLVVADEVYHLLNYTGESPPPTLGSFAESETVLSLGSFSKILAPGLRLGWIQAAPALLEPLIKSGVLDSGGGLNPFTSAVVRSALELGWQHDHLLKLREHYRQNAARLSQALRAHLPQEVSFHEPNGGFFLWLQLPEGLDAAALLDEAEQGYRVSYQPGHKFSASGSLRNCMRLSFAYYDPEQLQEGAERLGRLVSEKG